MKNMKRTTIVVLTSLFIISFVATPILADDKQELAKKSQNPIANMISLPFQNNTNTN